MQVYIALLHQYVKVTSICTENGKSITSVHIPQGYFSKDSSTLTQAPRV